MGKGPYLRWGGEEEEKISLGEKPRNINRNSVMGTRVIAFNVHNKILKA
jgi:hypothetical protein